ncbi:MAG TPA: tannase/feruloyl esterase family alpha/beta hydrolase [Vicinamibacterales bacterium]|nr:tannase/feruloyl esterase family alpha/beta hydrolase [Vicinamibacterales bacterium]
MNRFAVAALVAVGVGTVIPEAPVSAVQTATHAECSHLSMIRFPDVKITSAAAVAEGASTDASQPGGVVPGRIRAAHCRVEGTIGTEIRFRLLLPDAWNHKFLMGGGGGYVGTIDNQAQSAVNLGFATVGTDTGHQGGLTDASWAKDNPERQLNFGYLAVHRTAEAAKAIVNSYYDAASQRNYFSGCSNGGRQALMEAQRFPDDFDGVIAGAPAYDFVGIAAEFIKDIQAAFPDPNVKTPLFAPDTLKSVEAQILAKCDALDGVKDNLMDDPRKCDVDVDGLTGVSLAQKEVLKKIYAATGPNGSIYPGQPVGGEGDAGGWPLWITGGGPLTMPQGPSLRYAFGTQFFKYFVFNDPAWDYSKYDVSRARRDAALAATFMNATDAKLEGFKAKNRKLILWHGWSDSALTALASVQYYERAEAADPKIRDSFRMFMLPGVLHCGGGPGPDTADWTSAIVDWVEKGRAPERIVAKKMSADGKVARSRPLCPYPQHAVYSGSGSTDDEKNFTCK